MNAAELVRRFPRAGGAMVRRAAGRRLVRAMAAFRSPPWKWNVRRRLMACAALAAGAFALVTYGWRALDAGARAEGAAEDDALEERVRENRAKLARLPRLREAAGPARASARATGRPAGGDWQAVADLATRTGVKLISLEPAPRAAVPRGHPGEAAGRALRIDARTDFSALHAFMRGLATLPLLVVPGAVDIKREAQGLAFAAMLNVFDGPSMRPLLAANDQTIPARARGRAKRPLTDPFHVGAGLSLSSTSGLRLVGLLHDGRRALALIESASGAHASVAASGQTLGAERIVRIDALGVTLSGGAGERRLALPEAGQ